MRLMALAFFGLLGVCAVVLAQGQGLPPEQNPFPQRGNGQPAEQQPALPKLDPQNDPLDWLLVKWEQAMSEVSSFEADCQRTTMDKVFKKKEVYDGKAKYLKTQTDNLASLEMKRVDRPEVFEKYVCTGTFLYQYDPSTKSIKVHEMPKRPEGQVGDNSFLSFLFGMKAAQAKQRYEMKYLPPPEGDKWYYYIEIRPRLAADKVDFTRARLVLLKKNFMPRQLWFEEPNGNEITWDFPRVNMPANLSVTEFQRPEVPTGWTLQRVPSAAQPRIMRNQK